MSSEQTLVQFVTDGDAPDVPTGFTTRLTDFVPRDT